MTDVGNRALNACDLTYNTSDDEFSKAFGIVIANERTNRGISVEKWAEITGMTELQIERLESGKASSITAEEINALNRVGIRLESLLDKITDVMFKTVWNKD